MRSIASVRKIADPEKRLAAAATLARDAQKAADDARTERDVASVVMHKVDRMTQVEVVRRLAIQRTTFIRALNRVPDPVPHIEDAEKVAKAAHKRVLRLDALADEARDIRNDTIHYLIDDEGWRNARVATVARMPTARVAQIRKPLAG